ncbi:phosphogluconate dehydrogenase (NAD(+)-dependent, decarboxylating) [Mesotoga sp.]|uniref:phosphogluconate dehydrogenase (NAD(+)-dependent, decarboxylating) n=1 Tax=Mesotoga sp. TaxID=2053577 RepID=UPI002D10899C|nr:decarboxylating 6-phosphogluconate dehydrogenase [Mesotoga sp.]HRX66433.1 decarboxylating 6-phosphogluconate dehydrogenase [Mesotoga sp.]
MEIGIVGLGKMGGNIARKLVAGGHTVVGYNLEPLLTKNLNAEIGLRPSFSLEELVAELSPVRTIWLMIPAGLPTEMTIDSLKSLLDKGDVIIDGGNSNYKDSVRRSKELMRVGINFVDVGTSGGIWGLSEGYSMMIGGEPEIVDKLEPIFSVLAPGKDKGWGRVGPVGAGHYAKMIHNGIEYGLMQAYAEGFEILRSKKEFDFDLKNIAEIWMHGSVIRSWLLELIEEILKSDEELRDILPWVPDSGEGRWAVAEAIDLDVPAPVITLSLQKRIQTRVHEDYSAKLLAAIRNRFGGHEIRHMESGGKDEQD